MVFCKRDGKGMDEPWTRYGGSMDEIWMRDSEIWTSMEYVWTMYGRDMDKIWIRYGRGVEELYKRSRKGNMKRPYRPYIRLI
jgi:hypothetical protein